MAHGRTAWMFLELTCQSPHHVIVLSMRVTSMMAMLRILCSAE